MARFDMTPQCKNSNTAFQCRILFHPGPRPLPSFPSYSRAEARPHAVINKLSPCFLQLSAEENWWMYI